MCVFVFLLFSDLNKNLRIRVRILRVHLLLPTIGLLSVRKLVSLIRLMFYSFPSQTMVFSLKH